LLREHFLLQVLFCLALGHTLCVPGRSISKERLLNELGHPWETKIIANGKSEKLVYITNHELYKIWGFAWSVPMKGNNLAKIVKNKEESKDKAELSFIIEQGVVTKVAY